MKQRLTFKYIHPQLRIGLNSWRDVYLLKPVLLQLTSEVCRGKLIYRAKGSSRRFSYNQIKQGLVRQRYVVEQDVPDWLIPQVSRTRLL